MDDLLEQQPFFALFLEFIHFDKAIIIQTSPKFFIFRYGKQTIENQQTGLNSAAA